MSNRKAYRDVSKKKLGQFSKTLESTKAAFHAELEKLAELARAEILPYFKEHGLDFKAGNGSWCISRIDEEDGREQLIDDDALPTNIHDLLMLEIAYNDYLGFYVREIERGEW